MRLQCSSRVLIFRSLLLRSNATRAPNKINCGEYILKRNYICMYIVVVYIYVVVVLVVVGSSIVEREKLVRWFLVRISTTELPPLLIYNR